MLTRIVKMTFKKDKVAEFELHFNEIKDIIRNQLGCNSVVLYQDRTDSCVFFTYSIWNEEADLERYRNSDFFKKVWKHTKQLFAEKPEAWSLDETVKL